MLLSWFKYSTELLFDQNLKMIIARLLLLSFLSVWIFGFLLQAITTIDNSISNFLLSRIYSSVCHQESTKCISIGSASMLVCARCAGIYFGALISALIIFPLRQIEIKKNMLFITLLILCTDVLFVSIGIYDYSKSISFITGLMFGGIVYLYLMNELEHFLFTSKNKISK